MKIVKKYFIPHVGNDFKPHIMRRTSLAVLSSIAVFIFFVGVAQTLVLEKTSFLSTVIPRTLVSLANSDRAENALGELTINPVLEEAAQMKANDMAEKEYFAHVSPDGKDPWDWFNAAGYRFNYAGENLAVNFSDSSEVNDAWMNSPGHRANILNGKFTEVGIATARGEYKGRQTTFVVQMFGTPKQSTEQVIAIATPSPVTTISPEPENSPVLGAATPPEEKVLTETETFIAIQNTDPEPAPVVSVPQNPTVAQASFVEETVTSPKKTMSYLYLFLAGFIFLSLILMICIEIKRQHPKNIALGVAVLVLILALLYIYRTYIFTEVIVL